MARISVCTLGSLQIERDGEPATGFDSDKVRALLVYLAVEADRPHRRQALAGLLWPDTLERSARASLRRALANLRQVIGDQESQPPYLIITRQSIQFNSASDYWLDAGAFTSLETERSRSSANLAQLEEASSLYAGPFLDGFSVTDSTAFEDWLVVTREALQRQALEILQRLADHYEGQGLYAQALAHARRQVELEPWSEAGNRQVMRLLALSGRRGEALAQYDVVRRALAQELAAEPAEETVALYESILSGQFGPASFDTAERNVRGYVLRERLGSGSFGSVYRAYQTSVRRDVAVKIIRSGLANQPNFIRRFEVEAQLVARLEHPHIVPLYDYWRDPDGAYLVMRWLRGGSLRDDLVRGSWSLEPAVRLVSQIAAALDTAHRQGIVHRDIKPANILLDDVGNAYLSDFGIALVTEPSPILEEPPEPTAVASLSPKYGSPEQLLGKQTTTKADIYSLGVVLYELLTGRYPFADTPLNDLPPRHLNEPLPPAHVVRPDLPPGVDEVIQRATAKQASDRYAGAMDLAAAFREAVAVDARKIAPAFPGQEMANPYKGLRPFLEADAADFFGREALVDKLVARLATASMSPKEASGGRFLALIGSSGSGKSSVVRAGLVPALRRGALPGSEQWFVVQMTPGFKPLEELEVALLRIAVNPPGTLNGQIREDERGLLRAVKRALPDDRSRLLLIIDQFEELFTLVDDEEERLHFLNSLLVAVTDTRSPVITIVTLRADFYDRPLLYAGLGELVQQNTELVLPLSPAELERAIVSPAQRVGLSLEPGLVAAIIGDASEQPGALPMLQYALTELFEMQTDGQLTLDAFKAVGGVSGAMARRAEELFTTFDANSQEAARQIFLRLVTLGEGAADTRRRVPRTELEAIPIAQYQPATGDRSSSTTLHQSITDVIDSYGRFRLLSFDHDPLTRAPTVELAHEALLKEWQRLREWIDKAREHLRLYRQLATAAKEWQDAGQDDGFLLRGARLDLYEAWAAETDLAITPAERDYLQASLTERHARQLAEQARLDHEAALERRAINRLRALVIVLLVATVTAVGLSLFAFSESQRSQRSEATATVAQGQAQLEAAKVATAAADALRLQATAKEQARIATARELSSASLVNLEADPELSILLALEAAKETYAADGTVLREAEEALHRALLSSRTVLQVSPARSANFSPDGRRLATAGADDQARVVDASSGELLLTLTGHSDLVRQAIFSPDGSRIATTSDDGTAIIWDAESGEKLSTLRGHAGTVFSPAWSPAGDLLVTTGADGTARLWDTVTGREVRVLPHSGTTAGPDFSPDGRLVAIADVDASVARIWDVDSGQEVRTLEGHTGGVNEVTFSPDGQLLATAGSDDLTAKVWDASSGEELLTLEGHSGWVFAVDFSPDGSLIATGSQDGTAKIWDASTGKELLALAGHDAGIGKIFFSPDGNRIVTGSADGTAKVWDITPGGSRDWLTLTGHSDLVFNVDYSPDGARLATASWDGTAKVWDAATGREIFTLTGHKGEVARLIFSPSGSRLASASYDGSVKLWDAESGKELLTIDGHEGPVAGLAYSPNGKRLASSSFDGQAKIWDVATGQELLTLAGHDGVVFRIAFSADGARLATAGWDGTARIWDSATGDELLSLSSTQDVNAVAFSQDGARLVTAGWDGRAIVWDTNTGDALFSLQGHQGTVWDVAFSPNGKQLATCSFDGTAKLWDAETGQQLLSLDALEEGIPDLAFSPDGTRLAIGGNVARIYVLPSEELMAVARSRLTRGFTIEECQQYLHVDECPAVEQPGQ